jgi:hypothetical protein
VSASTTFDPMMILMDDATCYLGDADDSFDCTYPPTNWQCPAYRLPTEKGATYQVLVRPWGDCSDPVGEYTLSLDTLADPSLTLTSSDMPYVDGRSVTAIGTATVPYP